MGQDIPFNRLAMTGKELHYIAQAGLSNKLAGDGTFTQRCHDWLTSTTGSVAWLTHSCTAALEMAALLLGIQPGDEIIMPSYTFVSTANAFVLRGAVPVFVDIRENTLNLDERLIEAAITARTRAIVPVHYAGVACAMSSIMSLAQHYNLAVVEDAAQGLMATYHGHALGSIGDLGAYSFHETKNIICGEGGALLVNNPTLVDQAEIIREKGTDRNRFFRGEIDKYTWQTVGSSYLPSELNAAFLWAQLEQAQYITTERLAIWQRYHDGLASLEQQGRIRRPCVPLNCQHNAHMYYLLLDDATDRQTTIAALKAQGVTVASHYVPLHSSPAGQQYGRAHGALPVTTRQAARVLRLPLWVGLTAEQQHRVVQALKDVLS